MGELAEQLVRTHTDPEDLVLLIYTFYLNAAKTY